MPAAIYAIVNKVTGRRYIGSSGDVAARWRQHRAHLNGGRHANKYLQHSWRKHGWLSFDFIVLEFVEHLDALPVREQFYLDSFYPDVYNKGICAASPMRGNKHTEETRRRMSEMRLGKSIGPRSDEFREACSRRHKGKKLSVEHRQNIASGLVGTTKPASWKASLAKRNVGNKYALGLKRSMESVAAGAAKRKGIPHSEEQRAKLRAAWVRRKARQSEVA